MGSSGEETELPMEVILQKKTPETQETNQHGHGVSNTAAGGSSSYRYNLAWTKAYFS